MYGLGIHRSSGGNGERYVDFMHTVRSQLIAVGGARAIGRNPLKTLDEFNICRVRGWR
jgi:hypothetical protein